MDHIFIYAIFYMLSIFRAFRILSPNLIFIFGGSVNFSFSNILEYSAQALFEVDNKKNT